MRIHYVLVLVLLAFCASPLKGQQQRTNRGYLFVGPGSLGSCCAMLHYGAGFDLGIYKGLSAGAELGYLHPAKHPRVGVGVASANGYYHFRRDKRWDPFVTAGWTLAFRSGSVNLVNFGGGTNYWFGTRFGLLLEFRDHVIATRHYDRHWLGFRFGISIR
jgi:hypothetical protein